jgi:hypothetical protein
MRNCTTNVHRLDDHLLLFHEPQIPQNHVREPQLAVIQPAKWCSIIALAAIVSLSSARRVLGVSGMGCGACETCLASSSNNREQSFQRNLATSGPCTGEIRTADQHNPVAGSATLNVAAGVGGRSIQKATAIRASFTPPSTSFPAETSKYRPVAHSVSCPAGSLSQSHAPPY